MTFEEYWEQFGFEENSLNVYIPKSEAGFNGGKLGIF